MWCSGEGGEAYVPHIKCLCDPPRCEARGGEHQTRRDPERTERKEGRDASRPRADVWVCRVNRMEAWEGFVQDVEGCAA